MAVAVESELVAAAAELAAADDEPVTAAELEANTEPATAADDEPVVSAAELMAAAEEAVQAAEHAPIGGEEPASGGTTDE